MLGGVRCPPKRLCLCVAVGRTRLSLLRGRHAPCVASITSDRLLPAHGGSMANRRAPLASSEAAVQRPRSTPPAALEPLPVIAALPPSFQHFAFTRGGVWAHCGFGLSCCFLPPALPGAAAACACRTALSALTVSRAAPFAARGLPPPRALPSSAQHSLILVEPCPKVPSVCSVRRLESCCVFH
jgi:hypothetical protein